MALVTELRDYRLGLLSPLVTAHGVVNHREGVLFSISDGTHVGWGEAAPMPGWSRESLDGCKTVLASIAPRLVELDSVDDPRFGALLTELEARPHARAAVAGAAFDLLAHRYEVSIASLLEVHRGLGSTSAVSPRTEPEAPRSVVLDALVSRRESEAPRSVLLDALVSRRESEAPRSVVLDALVSRREAEAPRSVLVNGLVSDDQPEAVVSAAAGLARKGISAVKLKVAATDPRTDLARVAAAREAMGDEIELRLDANGGWDVDTAVTMLKSMADYNVAFCEEPTSGIDGIAAVGAAGAVPVAVDESAVNLSDIAIALKTDAISVVVIKPQALGGPDLALAAVAMVEESGSDAVVTTMIDSAIGVAHAAHVAAAALPQQAHGLATSALLANDTAPRLRVEGGRLYLPHTPGLGVS